MLALTPGNKLKIDGNTFTFTHKTNAGALCYKNFANGSVLEQTLEQAEQAYNQGHLELSLFADDESTDWKEIALKSDFLSRPKSHQDEAWRRKDYVDQILAAGSPSPQKEKWPAILEEIAEKRREKAPSWSNVKRWRHVYVSQGEDIRSLLPGYGARGRKRMVRSIEEQTFLDNLIAKYQSELRPTMATIIQEIHDRYAELKIKGEGLTWTPPSASSIRRLIRSLDPYETVLTRNGAAAARRQFSKRGPGFQASHRLELVEIDHTQANVMVLDEKRRAYLGRPWICIAIDKRTRMIVGLYIGFEKPSTFTIMQCIRNMIMPKTYLATEFPDMKLKWEAYGIPTAILLDNALENHSAALKTAAACLNIELRYAPVNRPEYKGTIERFNRSLSESGHTWLPGKTFGSIGEKGDYDPRKHACITLSDFRRYIHSWLLSHYCNALHRGINAVPAVRWAEEVKENPVRLPRQVSDLDKLLGFSKPYVLTNQGITIKGLTYVSDELNHLLRTPRSDPKVLVKRDLGDVGKITVIHPGSGEPITANCTNPHANGMSAYQHDLIRSIGRKQGKLHMNQEEYLAARLAHYRAAEDILSKKRSSTKDRSNAARAMGGIYVSQPKSGEIILNPEFEQDLDDILAEDLPVPMLPGNLDHLHTPAPVDAADYQPQALSKGG